MQQTQLVLETKMLPLPEKELNSHQNATKCYICRKKFTHKVAKDKNHQKLRGHCHFAGKYRGAGHSICNLRFDKPIAVSVVFHNGSNYDYHFIMKELVYEFKSQFEYLRGNTEKYQVFQFQFKKKSEKLVNMVMRLLELFLTK